MKNAISKILNILICPHCGGSLKKQNEKELVCMLCDIPYPINVNRQPDLKLKKPKKVNSEFTLNQRLFPENGFSFKALEVNETSEVDFSSMQTPYHMTREIMSIIPKAINDQSLMLDVGCGDAVHKSLAEHAGFQWIGLDYEAEEALMLGDAQALPFKDAQFEFILVLNMLAEVQFPWVAMQEIYRVLKPNGKIIGTVPFLEPSYGATYYHHTHLGIYNSLKSAGFTINAISPSSNWHGLKAMALMALFPRLPIPLATAIISPIFLLHRIWWKIGSFLTKKENTSEYWRQLKISGDFTFIATK